MECINNSMQIYERSWEEKENYNRHDDYCQIIQKIVMHVICYGKQLML